MAEHRRLDPETLLKRMQKEEEAEKDESGILKIYLGYSAGVGKTYRMLQNAVQLKKSGVDVVIGIVETHKRAETEALLEGFEIIPRKKSGYQGIVVEEMDLDAVLKRRPALVLVDELAHTNAPGSRNSKRYQDIEELIQAGINVVTTLNVQHLESVSDIVEQMTAVSVKEIVTDKFFDQADEIELVDISIEELEKRLKEGKVYIPEKARIAMLEFFKKSNLMGLRELSLRYTARQVGEEILSYMRDNAIKNPIPVGSRILVSISPSPTSQKLIRIAHRMAEDLDAEWFTVYVESFQFGSLNDRQKEQLAKNIKLAENLGSQTFTLVGNKIADETAGFAREHHITLILTGFSSRSRMDNFFRGSVVDELIRKAKPIQIMLVDTGKEAEITGKKIEPKPWNWASYILPTFIVIAFTAFCTLVNQLLGFNNITMLMLLPVLFIGAFWGKKHGIWASFLCVGALDFFFVRPFFTFSVEDIRYLPIFVVFFIVGVTTSILSDMLKWRIDTYRAQEKFLTTINHFSQSLLKLNNLNEIQSAVIKSVSEFFNAETVILLPNKESNLKISARSEDSASFNGNELGISQWVFNNGKTAGRGTDTLSSSPWYYLPLTAGNSVIGVIALLKKDRNFTLDEISYINSFTSIAAMTISRTLSMSNVMDYLMKSF